MQEVKPPSDAMESAARYWDAVGEAMADRPPNAVWRSYSDTINERLLARWLPRKRYAAMLKTDLFDESVGVGLCAFLSQWSDELHGIDLSEACVSAAGKRYPTLLTGRADVRQLPYPDNYFDCIVSNSTLDHFATPDHIEASVRELYRVARPGAELIITLDNLQNPIIWLRSVIPFSWLHRVGVLPYYVGATTTARGLRKKLVAAGFEVKSSTAILHCPRVLAIPLSRLLQKYGSRRAVQRWLDLLLAFEWLGRTPLRFLTGHFVAVHATRTPPPTGEAVSRVDHC